MGKATDIFNQTLNELRQAPQGGTTPTASQYFPTFKKSAPRPVIDTSNLNIKPLMQPTSQPKQSFLGKANTLLSNLNRFLYSTPIGKTITKPAEALAKGTMETADIARSRPATPLNLLKTGLGSTLNVLNLPVDIFGTATEETARKTPLAKVPFAPETLGFLAGFAAPLGKAGKLSKEAEALSRIGKTESIARITSGITQRVLGELRRGLPGKKFTSLRIGVGKLHSTPEDLAGVSRKVVDQAKKDITKGIFEPIEEK